MGHAEFVGRRYARQRYGIHGRQLLLRQHLLRRLDWADLARRSGAPADVQDEGPDQERAQEGAESEVLGYTGVAARSEEPCLGRVVEGRGGCIECG